jgi:hypothetical protein
MVARHVSALIIQACRAVIIPKRLEQEFNGRLIRRSRKEKDIQDYSQTPSYHTNSQHRKNSNRKIGRMCKLLRENIMFYEHCLKNSTFHILLDQ